MALTHAWMLLAVLGVLAGALVVGAAIGWRSSRSRRGTEAVAPVARAERVRTLPAFQRTVRRRMAALTAVLALGAGAVVVAGVIAARPQTVRTVDPVAAHRDIVLCLDVSGSMSAVNRDLLHLFASLAERFEGERMGLTVFDGSAVQVFPLTSDHRYVGEQLSTLASTEDVVTYAGTRLGRSSSLIGDGLAACVMHFDHPDLDRSRSIVLATDNLSGDDPIVTLEEAAAYAASAGVRVYAINPDAFFDETARSLADAAEATGGQAYDLASTDTIDRVIADVRREAIAELRGRPQAVLTDAPGPWIVVLVLMAGAFVVVMERVRL